MLATQFAFKTLKGVNLENAINKYYVCIVEYQHHCEHDNMVRVSTAFISMWA